MRTIVELRCGAHLYGTATPQSDTDLKSVFLPDARAILLQRAAATSTTGSKADGQRNTPADTDREAFSLHRFIDLLLTGQPIAIEMLFAPDDAITQPPDALWRDIQALAPSVVTRHAASFVRYCRQQANRYGIRGTRVADARKTLEVLDAACASHGTQARLASIEQDLDALVASRDHLAWSDIEVRPAQFARHLDICGRKAPLTTSLGTARDLAARILAEYGQRARDAEQQDGVDWKALSHALRVGYEAVELLRTGRLAFPLADAPRLLAVKLGRVPYTDVSDEIECVLAAVEDATSRSVLRDEPDVTAAEDLVARVYMRHLSESGV